LPILLRAGRHSQITAFFGEAVELLTQEGETSLLDQGHLSTTAPDVAQVYIYGDQSLFAPGSLRHDPPPGVDNVGVSQKVS
jgi:hypothetical protein